VVQREGKNTRRSGFRWGYIIKVGVNEMKWGKRGLGCSGSGWVQVAQCCDHSGDVSVSVKCGEFLDPPY
jgi:hypothetical protein